DGVVLAQLLDDVVDVADESTVVVPLGFVVDQVSDRAATQVAVLHAGVHVPDPDRLAGVGNCALDGDLGLDGLGAPVGVGHGQGRGVVVHAGVGVPGVDLGGGVPVTEVPLPGHSTGVGPGELHGQGRSLHARGARAGCGGRRAAGVGDPDELLVLVQGEEPAAVVEQVQRTVRPELGIHPALQLVVAATGADDLSQVFGERRRLLVLHRLRRDRDGYPVIGVGLVPQEPLAFPVGGPGDFAALVHLAGAVGGAGHHGLATAAQVRLGVGDLVLLVAGDTVLVPWEGRSASARGVPDHVGSGVGDVHQTGVAGRVVLQVVAVVPAGQDAGVLVAAVPVGLLIAHAVRPALVSRGGDHRGGLVLRRPQFRIGHEGVRAHPGCSEPVGLRVDLDP